MAPKEVAWQRHIIKRIRDEGGYGRKWASDYAVGVPDLILCDGGFTMFVECKLEHSWNKNTSRTLGFTSKQKEEAHKITSAGGVAFGLIIIHNGVSDVKLAYVNMPHPREQLRPKLQDLLPEAYDWTRRSAVLDGISTPARTELGQWLRYRWQWRNSGG